MVYGSWPGDDGCYRVSFPGCSRFRRKLFAQVWKEKSLIIFHRKIYSLFKNALLLSFATGRNLASRPGARNRAPISQMKRTITLCNFTDMFDAAQILKDNYKICKRVSFIVLGKCSISQVHQVIAALDSAWWLETWYIKFFSSYF